MWVSMCFPRAVDSYFIVKKRPYSLAKIATRGVRPGYHGARASHVCAVQRLADLAMANPGVWRVSHLDIFLGEDFDTPAVPCLREHPRASGGRVGLRLELAWLGRAETPC